jgi:hypothetical protein
MACAADDSLIDRVRNIFQHEYVRHHQDSHVLHFGAYPEKNCPGYKSTFFFSEHVSYERECISGYNTII